MPDLSGAVKQEVQDLAAKTRPDPPTLLTRDLRTLLWSSIDDSKSRDLDQVEYAESLDSGDTRLLVGIADVDAYVPQGSAIDQRAAQNGTSVYTGVKTFPMLPEELSTGLTSLNPGEDRLAVVTEMVVAHDGTVKSRDIYRALLNNHAKLAYETVGPWLDGKAELPPTVAAVSGLEAQLRLQFESAKDLRELRKEHGSLELGIIQAKPVIDDSGKVTELEVEEQNGARDLIANFMIAANVAMAQFLESKVAHHCAAWCARRSTGRESWRLPRSLGKNCPPLPTRARSLIFSRAARSPIQFTFPICRWPS